MSETCSRMYAEHVITRSARLAIHFSTPWMCDCGCLSTQPWWRPYSVAWIVTTNGQRKRFARWSPATATSQSCPCTTSKAKRSPSSTPAASMSAFMCSIQVTNSPSSRGRRGSRTRCTITPSISSSAGDSSWPRVSTCTSTSWRTRFSDSLRTCRASPPSINGGYSQDRIRARKLIGSSSYAEQGRDVELRREVAEVRIVDRPRVSQSIEGSDQLGVVLLDTPERVVAGHFVRVLERPVARLEGEQLARGALQGRVARACARGGGDRAQLGAAR